MPSYHMHCSAGSPRRKESQPKKCHHIIVLRAVLTEKNPNPKNAIILYTLFCGQSSQKRIPTQKMPSYHIHCSAGSPRKKQTQPKQILLFSCGRLRTVVLNLPHHPKKTHPKKNIHGDVAEVGCALIFFFGKPPKKLTCGT